MQKAADKIISEKLNLYDEKTYMHEINIFIKVIIIFIKMFIKVYYNSNIDCNRKVENKIYTLYQHYSY